MHNITINNLECVVDDNGDPMVFNCKNDAKKFLLDAGCTEEYIEDNIIIEEYVEVDENGQEL